jgi:hypothetical protein
MSKKKKVTRSTGVTLELPVFNYLVELAEREDRARSYCLNRIIRDYAERNGDRLPPPSLAEVVS